MAKVADATGLLPFTSIGPWQEGDSLGRFLQVLEVEELHPLHLQGQEVSTSREEEKLMEAWTSLLALPVQTADLFL